MQHTVTHQHQNWRGLLKELYTWGHLAGRCYVQGGLWLLFLPFLLRELYELGLDGTIPPTGWSLPGSLEILGLGGNNISGTVTNWKLPPNLLVQ